MTGLCIRKTLTLLKLFALTKGLNNKSLPAEHILILLYTSL